MPKTHVSHMNLGEFIAALKAVVGRDPDVRVQFDFNSMVPGNTGSYRGYYQDLAIAPEPHRVVTVKMVYDQFCALVGTWICGWKGGEYRVTEETALWVAHSGDASGTAVVGVKEYDYLVIIETAYEGY